MRKAMLTAVVVLVGALVVGCQDGPAQDEDAPTAAAERDTSAAQVCTTLVTARIVQGWRQTVGSEMADTGRDSAREFDRDFKPGSPEYASFMQRYQEGLPPLTRDIKLKGVSEDDAILAQTAEVAKYVRQDCEVAYGS
ncbi:hypothetical protein [Streptomyces tirandamycinicus]|uniref:Lipoprotein n=1 Tax=Streptomyces tirandamycinicus TaxID=2174846 RepID=A0A2S1T210_9ACTN|nr:hypothetical protein [Streptomyces tirandamycinicus]AWI32699.1 hypothetical protein DDW44_30755 [Streptomyces tirandamycinicus]